MKAVPALRDIHSERDTRRLALDRAGVKGLRYPICVLDRDRVQQHTVAEIDMSVSVPHKRRGAHNQRSVVSCRVWFSKFFWIEDLIALIESCASSDLYALLKRPDEKYVTEQAYERPRFVEDLVREVGSRLRADSNFTRWEVEAESFESIHAHSAYAALKFP